MQIPRQKNLYLGAKLKKKDFGGGESAWALSSSVYVIRNKDAVKNCEAHLQANYGGKWKLPANKAENPFPYDYDPDDTDVSPIFWAMKRQTTTCSSLVF